MARHDHRCAGGCGGGALGRRVWLAALVAAPVGGACGQCAGGWVAGIGVPGVNGPVRTVCVVPGGDVIASGSFNMAGGTPVNLIARYHPTTGTWSALGAGVNGGVYAMEVMGDSGLLVGG